MGKAESEDKDVFGHQRERGIDADLVSDVLLPVIGLHQVSESLYAFAVLSAHGHKGSADGADFIAGYFKFEPKQVAKDPG